MCQGQIWSQHAIDNGDGDGGICYPYYPSREHYLKPAQGPSDLIDCVCLDGWTCDFLAARRNGFEGGFNSRMGVGPIETVQDLGEQVGRDEMMATTAMHFDKGCELNGFGFVTGIWEVSICIADRRSCAGGCRAVAQPLARHAGDHRRSIEAAMEWQQTPPPNRRVPLNYRFDARGTGAPGSEKNLEIRWFMNQEFRLALLRNWKTESPEMVIDFTPATNTPSARTSGGLQRGNGA